MTLAVFLTKNKKEILQLCKDKVLIASESKPTSALLEQGLPIFYNELIEVLQRKTSPEKAGRLKTNTDAAAHGKESLRLGYTISQVVHAYGAVCQSVTEFVQTKSFKISSPEFQDLNLALDCAIAEAVTEFEKIKTESIVRGEARRLGFLIHELGNSLAAAAIAYKMIQTGRVGNSGTTSDVLGSALKHMRHLIDISLTKIRLSANAPLETTRICLADITSEIEAINLIMPESKSVHLGFYIDPSIQLTADRHLIFSAISNLVNNAMKFTKESGHVSVRGRQSGERILIEVEDECGGLPAGKLEDLFEPFIQKGGDKSGLGLGLSLSRKAIELNQGTLTVHNIEGKGCIFTIDLPKAKK